MPKAKIEKDTSERWLLTYADLMNLLLILFILLYTMANLDIAKYQQVAASLRAAFGDSSAMQIISESAAGSSMVDLANTAPSPVVPAELEEQQAEALQDEVEAIIKKEGLTGQVEVSIQERGVVISIGEQVLFKSGSADIEPDSVPMIESIGRVLLSMPSKQIKVEGHTDNVPISSSRFPDNQELSTARANSVWRILVKNVGLDPEVMSTVGYGEYRPKVPNTTPENKAQNRRVDIAILRDEFNKSESGADVMDSEGTDAGNSAEGNAPANTQNSTQSSAESSTTGNSVQSGTNQSAAQTSASDAAR